MSSATSNHPREEHPSTHRDVTTRSFAKSPSFEQAEKSQARQSPDQGVEVVLGEQGHHDKVVEERSPARPTPDQNVFRGHSGGRPRVRGPYPPGPPPVPPYVQGSGSFGYSHPDYPPRPFPVPPYNPSGSFDEAAYRRPPSHYSPHVHYPPPGGGYPGEDINVISPNHRGGDPFRYRSGPPRRPPTAPSYQYPPPSPVSRPGPATSPPRLRNSAVGRPAEGPYSKAQRSGETAHPNDGTWNPFPTPTRTPSGAERPQPPLVAESSFESDHFSSSHYTHPSHPPTPGSGAPYQEPVQSIYGPGVGSFGSFDSAVPHPPHYDYRRHHHHRPPPGHPYPESPYSPYSQHSYHSYHPHYSPGGPYYPPHDYGYPGYGPPQSYEDDERGMLKDYHPDRDGEQIRAAKKDKNSSKAAAGVVLPAAASEVDFDVHDPPMEPVCPPSSEPLVESLGEVNTYDVLCGRGGGTNSQIGNKRFRQLVQEFQPTYLLARRKEKPLLARSIVLIIRKRGGRFLRKDEESGMLYEVGDSKAEAKTSQALREGLDVRATKSAASNKKKKKKGGADDKDKEEEESKTEAETDKVKSEEETKSPGGPTVVKDTPPSSTKKEPGTPLDLPKLADEKVKAGMVHPHSPEALQFRKRQRLKAVSCGADQFFPDFCPPRADLGRTASPVGDACDGDNNSVKETPRANATVQHSPVRRSSSIDEDEGVKPNAPGCTAAAFEIMTGAVTGGLCFGPSSRK